MMRWIWPLILTVAVGDVPQACAAAPAPIAVTVGEPDGIARNAWPLSFSVPLPRGVLTDAARLTVSEGSGGCLPAQVRELVRWKDGSVRWALVDVQVALAPHQEKHLFVRFAGGECAGPRLKVAETSDEVRIDAGPLQVRVAKAKAAMFEVLDASGAVVVGPVRGSMSLEGRPGRMASPRSVELQARGPLRAQVDVRGDYESGFAYELRVEVFAGQPFLRVRHTFTNRYPAPYARLSRGRIEIPVAGGAAAYAFGEVGGSAHAAKLGSSGVRIRQIDNKTCRVGGRERQCELAGWAELAAPSGRVGIAARWFWQQYPQAIEMRPGALLYDFWPAEAGVTRAGIGAAKTHEFTLWVGAGESLPAAAAAATARPLVATVDPRWIARTGALPQAVAPAPPALSFLKRLQNSFAQYLARNGSERWDERAAVRCADSGPERPRVGAYGMWNWGDWNFPGYHDTIKGCDAWGNLEYDTTQVLALGYAATGKASFYEAMVAAARHFMDVDIIHFLPQHPEWVGMNHPKNPLHFTFELGGVDLGHTWTEGLVSYYYLTGDERGLAAARGIADYLVRRIGSGIPGANPRQWGWPQIALLSVYGATGDERYLEAARRYAHDGMRAHAPVPVRHWKLGVLADALAYTHAATADPAIRRWLLRYARGVVRDGGGKRDARFYPAVAYVAALTGDRQMRKAALARAAALRLGRWGKPLAIGGRIGFRIYSLLAADARARVTSAHPR